MHWPFFIKDFPTVAVNIRVAWADFQVVGVWGWLGHVADIMQTERLVPLVLVGLMVAIGVVMVFALVWPELMPFYRHLGGLQ